MSVSVQKLRVFLAVAKEQSFTDAAKRLHLTQAAVSTQVRELELQLGVRLFDRHSRRVMLSSVGVQFHPRIERVMEDLNNAVRSVSELKDRTRGTVRLAAPEGMACTLVPQAVAVFRESYPDVDVRIIDAEVDQIMALVRNGEVDLGFAPTHEADDQLIGRPLLTAPLYLVLPKNHPLASCSTVVWEDVVAYRHIAISQFFGLCRDFQSMPDDICKVDRITTALGMVRAGLGVSLCPDYAEPLVGAFGLEMRPLKDKELYRDFSVFSRRGCVPLASSKCFLDFFVGFAANQERWK
jgi:DNA-binding transcriptional LysR family regulator